MAFMQTQSHLHESDQVIYMQRLSKTPLPGPCGSAVAALQRRLTKHLHWRTPSISEMNRGLWRYHFQYHFQDSTARVPQKERSPEYSVLLAPPLNGPKSNLSTCMQTQCFSRTAKKTKNHEQTCPIKRRKKRCFESPVTIIEQIPKQTQGITHGTPFTCIRVFWTL